MARSRPPTMSTSPTPAALELHLRDLVGQLGQFAHRTVARRDGHDRHRIVVELGDDRRTGVARKPVDGRRHRGHARPGPRPRCCGSSVERRDDLRDAGARHRAQLRDALDGVDHLLEALADQHLDLFGRGAGQHRLDTHRRQVHRGNRSTPEPEILGRRPRRATARSCRRTPDA